MNLNDLYKKVSAIPIGGFSPIRVVWLIAWVYLGLFHRASKPVVGKMCMVANGTSMNGFEK